MDDQKIIELFYHRNESAIAEIESKYGRLLHRIARNILSNKHDSEEIVNDTYSKAWSSIPPAKPRSLTAYLGRITRNLSINRWNQQRAKKRYNGIDLLLAELGDCIPGMDSVEAEIETIELTRLINRWLGTLTLLERTLFVRRYWFGDSVASLAEEAGVSANNMAGRLYRLRQRLRKILEEEGITV